MGPGRGPMGEEKNESLGNNTNGGGVWEVNELNESGKIFLG